ncbi:Hypothetical predicted protein [Mytilus galloprovincialis]|uniref:SCP domain-containing protein n=1 Tax=Mytilus galloprovincialis TaxID=29158 RepID=A0A8B6GVB5_MYTGA|nr:Hypothetical predicted protein [Mytilus galloprovincialis]
MNLQVILLTTCVAVAFSSPIELEEKLRTLFADERELSLTGLGVSTRGTGTGSLLSKTEKSTILKLHRQARNDVQPTASNMQKMTWSKQLASVAQAYADKCIWGHNNARSSQANSFSYVGENLYVTTNKLVDAEILGEEALELKVENIDAFKLKQLELEHELKLKELEIRKEDEFKLKDLELKEMEKRKEDEFKLKQAELEMKESLLRFLRDTELLRLYVLEGVLPLSENTSVGASVLLQGVELGCCIDVPLHRIYLKSDLITGPVVVGVRPNLPVEGVTLLLGNDLARNKVVAEPIVYQ